MSVHVQKHSVCSTEDVFPVAQCSITICWHAEDEAGKTGGGAYQGDVCIGCQAHLSPQALCQLLLAGGPAPALPAPGCPQ